MVNPKSQVLPTECPVIRHPEIERAKPEELRPILERLESRVPVSNDETYQRGTLRPNGTLDLCKQGLGADGTAKVLNASVNHPHVRHLLLGTNGLGTEGTRTLAGALDGEHQLETLYLGCNFIEGEAVAPLCDKLKSDTKVRALWLKRNPLGPAGIGQVADMLATNRKLRTLDLVNTGVTRGGLRQLAKGLTENGNPPLERLYLGGNGLGPDAAQEIESIVNALPCLEFISVEVNRLGDAGFQHLVQALTNAGRELGLGIASNGITSDSASTLNATVEVLKEVQLGYANSTRVLKGQPNQIGDDGAWAIAAAMLKRRTPSPLRAIDLSHNGITSRGALKLVEALETAPHRICRLKIGKGIASSYRQRIDAALSREEYHPADDAVAIASRYR